MAEARLNALHREQVQKIEEEEALVPEQNIVLIKHRQRQRRQRRAHTTNVSKKRWNIGGSRTR